MSVRNFNNSYHHQYLRKAHVTRAYLTTNCLHHVERILISLLASQKIALERHIRLYHIKESYTGEYGGSDGGFLFVPINLMALLCPVVYR